MHVQKFTSTEITLNRCFDVRLSGITDSTSDLVKYKWKKRRSNACSEIH
jgi:hypothetical protein